MTIALFHFHVTQIKRSTGQSAVAAAAYRSGEKLHSEYYGEDSDYTRKGGVICSEILLPAHAPPEYADREALWNAVEKVERGKKAQLAYSFDIAFPESKNQQFEGNEYPVQLPYGKRDSRSGNAGRSGEHALGILRRFEGNANCPFVLYVGTRKLVKRRAFEEFIEGRVAI